MPTGPAPASVANTTLDRAAGSCSAVCWAWAAAGKAAERQATSSPWNAAGVLPGSGVTTDRAGITWDAATVASGDEGCAKQPSSSLSE